MSNYTATAIACPNIALIKYWGNRDHELRIPENGSISFNMGGLNTSTTVRFDPELRMDQLTVNNELIENSGLKRVSQFLNIIREMAGRPYYAQIDSTNNFPIGAGVASSAAAFAALALAGTRALNIHLSERDLSRLARRGSGSACRSIPPGFVEWLPGHSDEDSFAFSIAPSFHWNLMDIVVIVQGHHKAVGSTAGHTLANTSPIQKARIADAPRRLTIGRDAIMKKDFAALAEIVELDSNLMHAVMMTSNPPLIYWEPATILIMKLVPIWRQSGIPICYTLDAGPNIHLIIEKDYADTVCKYLEAIQGIEKILVAPIGEGAHLLEPK